MIYLDPAKYKEACDIHSNILKDVILCNLNSTHILDRALKKYILDNLEEILTGLPPILIKRSLEFESLMESWKQKRKNKNIKELKKVINYDWFIEKKVHKYDAYDLAKNLNTPTCAYCNRQYTVAVLTGKQKSKHITRPQLDHFFPKSIHPILALSFYNLIPSCSICNSALKGDIEFKTDTHLHPYIDNCIDKFRFSFHPKNTESLKGKKQEHKVIFKINADIDDQLNLKISNTIEAFKILEIYNAHSDEISDLLKIRELMSDKYLEVLKKTYNLNISEDELYRLAFGTYRDEREFIKRPFSKLKRDILEELGII
jgi:hypothetical protein